MFGKAKKLAERVSQLEKELELERLERAKAEAALAEYVSQKDMNARVFEEMRAAMEHRLKDIDDRAASFESFKTGEIQKLEDEKQQAREEMKLQELSQRERVQQELELSKAERIGELEQRLGLFNKSINTYLATVQEVLGVLTTAVIKAGKDVFSDDAQSLSACFQKELEALKPYSYESAAMQSELPSINKAQLNRLLDLYTAVSEDERTQRNEP